MQESIEKSLLTSFHRAFDQNRGGNGIAASEDSVEFLQPA